MFKFRLRSPARDRETDETRLGRLAQLIDQLLAEIVAERSGLQRRYDSVVADAAFLLDSMENEAASASSRKRSDDLTSIVTAFEFRMKTLDQQQVFFTRLRQSASIEAMTEALQHPS